MPAAFNIVFHLRHLHFQDSDRLVHACDARSVVDLYHCNLLLQQERMQHKNVMV